MNPRCAASAINRSMPACTVIPVLAYPDVGSAVEWLCRCFGFEERLRIGNHRSQLVFGGGAIVVAGTPSTPSAETQSPSLHSIMVRVSDVDAHYRHAIANGVRVLAPPADFPYGERQYTAEDLAAHAWTFSQTIADVDPASWGGELRVRC